MKTKPVLMIVTSHSSLGTTGKPTGIWAEEMTTPYYVLSDAGFEVVISSPQGGRPPFADGSVKADPTTNVASVARFFSDKIAMGKFEATHKTASVTMNDYSAVFLPGGHGTMWDIATDEATTRLVGDAFNTGKPTVAVCHGSAGLIKALRNDGKSILQGRRVNGFTNAEEVASGLMNVVPF
jgi:putative intracellular protease/amidase